MANITLTFVFAPDAGDISADDPEVFTAAANYGPNYFAGTEVMIAQGDVVTAPIEIAQVLRRKGCIPQPSPPLNVTATAISATAVDVEWDAALDDVGVAVYGVEVDSGEFEQVAHPTLISHVTGLTTATEYDFRVRARDAVGRWSGYSAVVSETTQ